MITDSSPPPTHSLGLSPKLDFFGPLPLCANHLFKSILRAHKPKNTFWVIA